MRKIWMLVVAEILIFFATVLLTIAILESHNGTAPVHYEPGLIDMKGYARTQRSGDAPPQVVIPCLPLPCA